MIHCILGHSASGKTTVQTYLKNKIPSIVTYTTRPIRHNEIKGVHYNFLTNEEFVELLNKDYFIEHYYIKENEWYYGLSLEGIDYKNKDYTAVIDPSGYKKIIQRIDKKYVKCYYINLSEKERLKRMRRRRDNEKEIQRRIVADRKDFEGFEKFADVILTQGDSEKNSKIILKNIGSVENE